MASRTYDAIVIGAGSNGLACAAYLQRGGLATAIIERRHEEGGGVNTEEPVLSGYRHNLHGNYMCFHDIMPMYRDFDLPKLGSRTVMPEVQVGIAFADGRPPIVWHRPDLLDKTYESIARYSKSDAKTFVQFKKIGLEIEPVIAAVVYNGPQMETEIMGTGEPLMELVENLFAPLGVGRDVVFKSSKAVIDDLFETDELRAMMYRYYTEWGFPMDQSCSAGAFLLYQAWLTSNAKLQLGGTHGLAKAMTQACYAEGVDLIENTVVERILVDGSRAVGVRVRGGEEIMARKVVASNADVQQTLLELVGEEHLSPQMVKRAKGFRYGPAHCLGTPMFCLYDPPNYKSARWDPDINEAWYTIVGYESAQDAIQCTRDAYSGRVPAPSAGTWVNTLWDKSQAPPGRHAATGWYFLPKASDLTPEEWAEVRAAYNYAFLDVWENYAPNMTRDNVIAHKLYTPDQIEVKNRMREGDWFHGEPSPDQMGTQRPFPEASGYRMEVEGLYLCGPSAWPGGGVHGACGYNAAKAIAEDLELDLKLPDPDSENGRLY